MKPHALYYNKTGGGRMSTKAETTKLGVIKQNTAHDEEFSCAGLNVNRQVTPPYLPEFKNPCWRQRGANGTLLCVPYVFLAGEETVALFGYLCVRVSNMFLAGFPKCGTTDLHSKIIAHPLVSNLSRKEPHFITRNIYKDRACAPGSEELVDSSASTAWDNCHWTSIQAQDNCTDHLEYFTMAPALVARMNPNTRFIMILREPVERAFSNYAYFNANLSLADFHDSVEGFLQTFQDCCIHHSLKTCAFEMLSHGHGRPAVSLYHVYIREWLAVFPRENFHFVRLEDYHKDITSHIRDVYHFLGLRYREDGRYSVNFMWKVSVKREIRSISKDSPSNHQISGDARYLPAGELKE
ncbi:carbohydrate sulfotransferase 15-like [Aplysia californica]|uniref:Carbohydrate sulfotransferase 15-like n=1 Tax=Aplysia californica TaxID=6500 RepID=A0ABM0JIG8_APLCA|nr:carbohydrate sulfotransferase 15-like [Aplysia californica]